MVQPWLKYGPTMADVGKLRRDKRARVVDGAPYLRHQQPPVTVVAGQRQWCVSQPQVGIVHAAVLVCSFAKQMVAAATSANATWTKATSRGKMVAAATQVARAARATILLLAAGPLPAEQAGGRPITSGSSSCRMRDHSDTHSCRPKLTRARRRGRKRDHFLQHQPTATVTLWRADLLCFKK